MDEIPVAVVGVTFRTMSGQARARLSQLELLENSRWQSLQSHGKVTGIVRVETCSRVEWVLSSSAPAWAGELFRALLAREASSQEVLAGTHLRAGEAAVRYLLRVVAGLDSVAEGESAVGRQVLRAFELGHDRGQTDTVLNALWRHCTALVMSRRECHELRDPTGVQNLVMDELRRLAIPAGTTVTQIGRGGMGKALRNALVRNGFQEPPMYGRAEVERFKSETATAGLVCVASAAGDPWIDLPERSDNPLVVDVSCPTQVRTSPGWTLITLDDLLASEARRLPESARVWLEERVRATTDAAIWDLSHPKPADLLRDLDSARKAFLADTLPRMLEGLPDPVSANIRREFSRYAHDVIRKARSV